MTLALLIVVALVALVATVKWIRWRWYRDPMDDRWLAARAIEELLRPDGYYGEVEEFSSIPIGQDEVLRRIRQGLVDLLADNGNFVQPLGPGREYADLPAAGREKAIALGHVLERELPGYRVSPSDTAP